MEKLADVWTEVELAEKMGLPYNKETGQSKTLGNWIAKGLKCFHIGRRRYFIESDVVGFLEESRGKS